MRGIDRGFEEDGFAVIEGAIEEESLAALRHAAGKLVAAFDIDQHRSVFSTTDRDSGRDEAFFQSARGVHCFLEEDALDAEGSLVVEKERAINKIGHAMHDQVEEFGAFCRLPLLGDLLRGIGMKAPLLYQTMYIFKQPGIGGEVRWHQDASYLISRPSGVVGMWIAMEDSTRDNGCLWMQPGGHRSPLREIYEVDWSERRGSLRTLDRTPWPEQNSATPLEVPAGTIVVFHDHMPHYSSRNGSPISRQALTLHAVERGEEWCSRNWLQREAMPDFAL